MRHARHRDLAGQVIYEMICKRYSAYSPLLFNDKLRPHEGQVDKFVCIANPQSGQTRFVCKWVTIRDTRIIPKSRRIRNATSHGPICIFTFKFRYVAYLKLSLKVFNYLLLNRVRF